MLIILVKDTFEIQRESIKPGQNILIVDDLLATGGITTINFPLTIMVIII